MRSNGIILSLATVLAVAACDSSSPSAPANGNLEVLPSTATMTAGASLQLTVTGQDGTTITGVTWTSAAPHIVGVSASGLATAMYGDGPVSIRASVGTASGQSTVTVVAACASPAPLEGSPPIQPAATQAFEVRFEDGVDAAARSRQLAQQIGFLITETTANSFKATLTPQQVNTLRCVEDVASVVFV